MGNIKKVYEYLKNKISGNYCVIFYGSSLENNKLNQDVDCCILTDTKIEINYDEYIHFLINNGIKLDFDIKYQDKLILETNNIDRILESFEERNDSIKIDLDKNYYKAVNSLLFNVLTTKVKVYGNYDLYNKYSKKAWECLINKYRKDTQCIKFEYFCKKYNVGNEYKDYHGYSFRVIDYLNNKYNYYIHDDLVIKLLKDNVIKYPHKIAIQDETRQFTYKELDENSDKIASALIKNDIEHVIVDYPHCIEQLFIIYGIYKAGKTYVPIDNSAPKSEKDNIINNFENYIYISNGEESDLNIEKTLYNEHTYVDYKLADVAYIIHTSGTTGKPKGVEVTRKNLEYILYGIQEAFGVDHEDKYLYSTRNTFDVSISEIFGFLFNGAGVFVHSVKNTSFIKRLPEFTEKFKITHTAMSPSVLRLILNNLTEDTARKLDNNLKYIIVAGEEFRYELKKQAFDVLNKVNIINAYGPTECTVYATWYKLTGKEDKAIPIGKPFKNANYIIDDGELLISGDGVAKGYYNREDITADKFININGTRYYRTGDIVELVNDNLIYKRRRDNQVQIHGIRVELDGIREVIKKVIDIDDKRDIEVIYKNEQLILFYTGEEIENLRDILKNHLHSYTIPSKILNIKEFPLNANGKKDLKLLSKLYLESNYNDENDRLRQIVYNFTGKIDDDKPIYTAGVDSLSGIELFIELEKEYGIVLDNVSIYELSTINSIRNYISSYNNREAKATKNKELDFNRKKPVGEIKYEFPLYYYARIYETLNFNSVIYDEFEIISKDLTYDKIKNTLEKVEVFKSFINLNKGEFEVRDTEINFDFIEVDDIDINIEVSLANFVIENKSEGGYLYKFVYLTDGKRKKLCFAISHSIFDKSCVEVLKRMIITGETENNEYSKYILAVDKYNDEYKLDKVVNDYDIEVNEVSSYLSKLEDTSCEVVLDINSSKTVDIYTQILEYLKEVLFNRINTDIFKVNLITNIRKFNGIDAKNTLGDIHTGVIVLLNKNDSIKDTIQKCFDYYKENTFIPKYVAYKNYPYISDNEAEYVRVFDDDVLISINYLGIISKNSYDELLNNYKHTRKEVDKLNSKKLNISAYILENKLHIFLSKEVASE